MLRPVMAARSGGEWFADVLLGLTDRLAHDCRRTGVVVGKFGWTADGHFRTGSLRHLGDLVAGSGDDHAIDRLGRPKGGDGPREQRCPDERLDVLA